MVLRRVILTGASGLLGRHMLALLARHEIQCVCLCRTQPNPLPQGCSWAPWELTAPVDANCLDALCPETDALIHLGALTSALDDATSLMQGNVAASKDLARWARERHIPLAYVSGAVVYADPGKRGITEDSPLLTAPGFGGLYGWSKLQGEQAVRSEVENGLSSLILRPSSLYGLKIANDKLVGRFLQRAMAGETIAVTSPTSDRVNFVHAADVAAAFLHGLLAQAWGVFNIGGTLATIQELAQACIAVSGKGRLQVQDTDMEPGKTRFDLNCAAAEAAFGYRPSISLAKGLTLMSQNHYLPD